MLMIIVPVWHPTNPQSVLQQHQYYDRRHQFPFVIPPCHGHIHDNLGHRILPPVTDAVGLFCLEISSDIRNEVKGDKKSGHRDTN
jgi:hypothetical protein